MLQSVQIREGHDNFFTPLRLILALLVVVGHAFVIGERSLSAEPNLIFDYSASYIAVNMFFIASGFLVTKSMLYRSELTEYSAARIMRIYPALILNVFFVMFLVGPFVTNLPLKEFFTDPQFWSQPFQVLSFLNTNMVLPGALTTNHETYAGGPLWTLRYEVLCYLGTALAFSLGLLRNRWLIAAQFVVFMLLWPLAHTTGVYDQLPATAQNILRFGIAYGLGAAIFAFKDYISFHIVGIPIIVLFMAMFQHTPYFEVAVNVMLAYGLFWAAFVQIPSLDRFQSMGDISYGVYIYHWPIMQWIMYKNPEMPSLWLLTFGVIGTVAISIMSWVFVEKPMIKHKGAAARWMKTRLGGKAKFTKDVVAE